MPREFFIDDDGDGNNYVIPVDRQAEWFDWRSKDFESCEIPDFVERVWGAPLLVKFKMYRIK